MSEKPIDREPTKEKNSSMKVKFWLTSDLGIKDDYIGEISVVDGNIKIVGQTDHDTDFLQRNLHDTWIPQSGVPVFEKDGDGFKELPGGRYNIIGYSNPHVSTPDEMVQALYDYERAMKAFRVELVPA